MNSHDEEKNTENKLVTLGDISEAFRSEISKIIYAWDVVKLLAKVKQDFIKKNTITISYLNKITQALQQSLQDSSEVDAVFRLLVTYLKNHNEMELEKALVEKAGIVSQRSIDFRIPEQKAKDTGGMMKFYIEGDDIIDHFELLQQAELVDQENCVLRVKSFLLGLLQQEKTRIEQDFRLYENSYPNQSQQSFTFEKKRTLDRLQQYCQFVQDVLLLRSQYDLAKTGFYGKVSDKKKAILKSIEASLAGVMRDVGRLNVADVYINFSAALQENIDQIDKPGKLKTMLQLLKQKYDTLFNPNLMNRQNKLFGKDNK